MVNRLLILVPLVFELTALSSLVPLSFFHPALLCCTRVCNVACDETQSVVCFGNTMVVGPMGETLAKAESNDADELVVAELHLDTLADVHQRIPLADAARHDVYGT